MRFKSREQLEKWIAGNRVSPAAVALPKLQSQQQRQDPSLQRRILGVDTALRCTGWGIIDCRGNQTRAVDCGVVRNSPKDSLSACLRRLSEAIDQLQELYHPDIAVLEGAFYCQNARTAMILGSARGAVIAALARKEVQIYEYAPRKVKQAITGFGNATKEQVARLVSQMLNIKTDSFALDSTDALAMALCHAQQITVSGGFQLPSPL